MKLTRFVLLGLGFAWITLSPMGETAQGSKADIVNLIADKAGISKASATDALDAMIEAIEIGLANAESGEGIRVPGLGTFTVKHRVARTGQNPNTGETIEIPASYSIGFKAAKNLKDSMMCSVESADRSTEQCQRLLGASGHDAAGKTSESED